MPTHKGQIAFPGGKREEEDIDIVSTAVRESTEELLLPVSAIRPFGYLNSIDTVEYKIKLLRARNSSCCYYKRLCCSFNFDF